ncbi:protein phosphatase 2C domain-containing protein [Streptomyces sp. TS71-3]|uniref:protein phosphatase 2C domain-containing protein n=1 Tax=Streptomyces sp. TS71-3 TaxID=2733862 RepID=UPI002017AE55|nr:protein phosphatase 2C domain-containing protein [Streptomyces sp. TS71-3]
MSQQGERRPDREDDWWGELYEDAEDTGPARTGDTLDDRFASAYTTVREPTPSSERDPGTATEPDEPDGRRQPDTGQDDPHIPPTPRIPPTPHSPDEPHHLPEPPRVPEPPELPEPPSVEASLPPGPSPTTGEGGFGLVDDPAVPFEAPPYEPPAYEPPPFEPPEYEPPAYDPTTTEASAAVSPPPPPGEDPSVRDTSVPDTSVPDTSVPDIPDPADTLWEPPAKTWEPPRPRPASPPQRPPTSDLGRPSGGDPWGSPAPTAEPPAPSAPAMDWWQRPTPTTGRPAAEPGGPHQDAAPPERPAPAPPERPAPAPAERPAPASPEPPSSPEPPAPAPAERRPPAFAEFPAPAPAAGTSGGPETDTVPDGGAASGGARVPRPVRHVGDRPPTYDAEPTALPPANPEDLSDLVPDTVLDGARYGSCTLRAASVRGDSARYRGEPRRDSLLTARFGTGRQALVLVAMATGARAGADAHRLAAEACQEIGRFVGRHHTSLAEDMGAGRRGALKAGLQRLTDRSLGKLRARAVELGAGAEEYTPDLRCLLLPADPHCRTRVFFGVGPGGLFRIRGGAWQDIEPYPPQGPRPAHDPYASHGSHEPYAARDPRDPGTVHDPRASQEPEDPDDPYWEYYPDAPRDPRDPGLPGGREPGRGSGQVSGQAPYGGGPDPRSEPAEPSYGDRFTMALGITPPGRPGEQAPPEPARPAFRFHAAVAASGDVLLMCSEGLAEPLRGEAALAAHLTRGWGHGGPPGLTDFLADIQVRVKGYADDRTAAAVWET